ncbi:hypothetical protein [Nonlabens sp. MB-3u-79]|uniref:hypothetical protein n=1 Tax=Nonlabens sp. MB-3u-79 TaxID=2058134 RepID=UPI0012FDCD36|nr:hypothetical protein [Nonlabens sp. MB-3u-79]
MALSTSDGEVFPFCLNGERKGYIQKSIKLKERKSSREPKFVSRFFNFAYCLLPTAYCLLPTAYCLLPTAYCLLPTAYCLLPTAYCLLPHAYCLLPTASCLSAIFFNSSLSILFLSQPFIAI